MTPKQRLALAAVLAVVLGLVASRLRFTDDLASLLPADGPLPRALEQLERFQVADTIMVEVDGTGVPQAELLEAVDSLGARLEADPAIRRVRWRVRAADGMTLQKAAAPYAVELVPAEILAARGSPEGLRGALRGWLLRLAGPGGGLFEGGFRQDPLDVTGLALQQLRGVESPFAIQVVASHFLDQAGERAVLLVEPVVSTMEMGPDAPLIQQLEAHLASCALPARYLGGHRIAAESASSVRDDVQRAAVLGVVAMLGLFLLGFRSLRPVVGAAAPLALALVATMAAGAIVGPVHGISLGFAAALLGLAVDYWIHLYVAAQAREPAPGFEPRLRAAQEALAEIGPALAMGAASTVGAFTVLLLSHYPVVQGLGAMGLAAAAGALVGTWLLGPLAFAALGGRRLPGLVVGRLPGWVRLVLVLVVAGALALVGESRFDGDPRNLLPPAAETQALEAELTARYGGFGTGGMVVIEGPDLGAVLDSADRAQQALGELSGVTAAGPSALLPGPTLRAARRAALPKPAVLQAELEAAAVELGFAPGVFAGAAERLLTPASQALSPASWTDTPLAELIGRHVQPTDAGWSVMISVVTADDSLLEPVAAAVQAAAPGAELVVPSGFARAGIHEIQAELRRLGGLAAGWVLLLLALRYRRPRMVVAAFVPCAAALVLALGSFALLGVPWNAVSMASMVLILGLGLDYGVFMAEGERRGAVAHTGYAVLLSALTTLTGFGILVVARSPALFGVGLAVLVGMSTAAITALALVPAIVRGDRLLPRWMVRWVARFAWLALLGMAIDVLLGQVFYLSPPRGPLPAHQIVQAGPGELRFGPHRLVRSHGVHSAWLVGDAWERGYAAGALTAPMDERLEGELLATFERAVPSALARFAIVRGAMMGLPSLDQWLEPEQRLEIAGYVAGTGEHHDWLAPGYTRKVYYHAVHDIGQALVDSPVVHACTGFMAGPGHTADGHWLLARNFDFDGGRLFDQDKLVSFVVPTEGIPFASVSFASFSGVVSGMNAEGLAIALQAGASSPPTAAGTPMGLIAREILQQASSLDEVEAILRRRQAFVAENILVVDGGAGEAALFEVTPERIERLPVQGGMAVSNHFRAPAFAEHPVNIERMAEGTTVPRLARMEALLDEHRGDLDMDAAVAILRDRRNLDGQPLPRGHRHAIDADIATHSVIFDTTARTLWVSRSPNTAGGYVAWELDEALAGAVEPVEVVPSQDLDATLAVHRARSLLRGAEDADPAEAEAFARQALELMPAHPQALQALAQALLDQGHRDEALPLAQRALDTPPEHGHQVRELRAMLGLEEAE
jgi:isopenicillin-N N-acyltransferase-like protein